MYSFFTSYDGVGAPPSFEKFARTQGTTLDVLLSFRRWKKFDAAYRECSEIRRDYLIDGALARRFDPSFTKHLIELEKESGAAAGDDGYSITLRVIE